MSPTVPLPLIGPIALHLDGRFIFTLPQINDMPEQTVRGPLRVADLDDQPVRVELVTDLDVAVVDEDVVPDLQYVADHWYVHRGQLADARRADGLAVRDQHRDPAGAGAPCPG